MGRGGRRLPGDRHGRPLTARHRAPARRSWAVPAHSRDSTSRTRRSDCERGTSARRMNDMPGTARPRGTRQALERGTPRPRWRRSAPRAGAPCCAPQPRSGPSRLIAPFGLVGTAWRDLCSPVAARGGEALEPTRVVGPAGLARTKKVFDGVLARAAPDRGQRRRPRLTMRSTRARLGSTVSCLGRWPMTRPLRTHRE